MPDVENMTKKSLAFEKEVLGVYISGHPLEKYEKMWQKNIHGDDLDFQPMEENWKCRRSRITESESLAV